MDNSLTMTYSHLFCVAALLLVVACASPSKRFDQQASRLGFDKQVMTGKGFVHTLYNNNAAQETSELHVYLAPIDPVPDTVGVELEGALDLGLLKGNIGEQNYPLPSDLDLSLFKSVVIWCQPFRVPFNAAALTFATQ